MVLLRNCFRLAFPLCVAFFAVSSAADDTVVLKTGSRISGKVLSYDATSVNVEAKVGSRTVTRNYPSSQLKSLIVDGVDIDLASVLASDSSTTTRKSRSKKEVLEDIGRLGSKMPAWFESTPLAYPPTLDLTWPEKPTGSWDGSKNVGQFIWDRINPNPGKWREGVRLAHHIISTTEDKALQRRAMLALGTMFHNLLQDYARAAYWYQLAGVDKGPTNHPQAGLHLCNCYWQLGNKDMALSMLNSMSRLPYGAIKLLADMGETDDALEMAERFSKSGEASQCFLYAGDACRIAGRLKEAEDYYRRAITAIKPEEADKPHRKRDKARAEASLAGAQCLRSFGDALLQYLCVLLNPLVKIGLMNGDRQLVSHFARRLLLITRQRLEVSHAQIQRADQFVLDDQRHTNHTADAFAAEHLRFVP